MINNAYAGNVHSAWASQGLHRFVLNLKCVLRGEENNREMDASPTPGGCWGHSVGSITDHMADQKRVPVRRMGN